MKLLLRALSFLLAIAATDRAHAEKRVALVIGNSDYENTTVLKNPRNDASDMATLLRKLGFSVVEGVDLDKRKMERAIRDFGIKLAGADLALFFYAGHGLQVNGKNYVVPTDARLSAEGDLDFEVLELALVLKQMEREANTRVVLLDACRDNPLVRSLRTSMGASRSSQLGQGLAKVERTQVGTLIGYATEPGNVASDGEGRNSPYTQALLKHLGSPGKDLGTVLSVVRGEVVRLTASQQVPWEHTSLLGPVYINRPAEKPEIASAIPAAKPDVGAEVAFWNSVQDSKAAVELQTYLDRFPTGTYAALARLRIDRLKEAEANRKVDETRKTDEARKTEDARKAEESRRAAEAIRAEEARRIEESRSQEAARKAEAARKTGETTKLASLPVETAQPPLSETPAADKTFLARTLQKELARVGCDPGAIDGKWGGKAKEALNSFTQRTKSTIPKDDPSEEALSAVTMQKGRVCPLQCATNQSEINGQCVTKDKPRPKQQEAARPQAPSGEKAGAKSGGKEPMCWTAHAYFIVPCSHPHAGQRAY